MTTAQDAVLGALGLMSGTSLDGIDLAVLHTDGERSISAGRDGFVAYGGTTRDALQAAMAAAAGLPTAQLADKARWPDVLVDAEALVTQAHVAAVQDFLSDGDDVSLIGFHGQTLIHRPDEGFTLQAGDASALAAATGLDTVGRFRHADMEAGGQGAPLAPLFHAALVAGAPPQAVLNLGGVGNITWLGEGGALLAFDTGPANAPIDDWVCRTAGRDFDTDGALAAAGTVDRDLLQAWLAQDYFAAPPPKSLDRMSFDLSAVESLSPQDGAATLTAFSAAAVGRALLHCPQKPQRLIVCGGGRRNPTLCAMLQEACGVPVVDCDALGWNGDALEAQAFAWLAVRSVKGLPLSLPQTTGARAPVSGGELFRV